MGKRGLSQIITTIILILLILVAISAIWAIVNNLILKNSGKISTDSLTLSLTLRSAKIDYETGLADVRVRRNQGAGNIIGIKFIAEDKRNSDVFEERFTSFPELAERTFTLNISQSEILNLPEVHKISIAPIFLIGGGSVGGSGGSDGGSGSEQIGSIAGSLTGLNSGLNGTQEIPEEQVFSCQTDNDCPSDYFLDAPLTCDNSGTQVIRWKKDWHCVTGGFSFCDSNNVKVTVEICPTDSFCDDGACVEEKKPCSNETLEQDCGISRWIGPVDCHQTLNATAQDYIEYSCVEESCESTINSLIKMVCEEEQICFRGECFTPLECTDNYDCQYNPSFGPGYICEEGFCVQETIINNGTILSIWPFNLGEYFDSVSLEKANADYSGMTIIFPGSEETRCLKVIDHVLPENPEDNAYVKLDLSETNIASGDKYEIWETSFVCTAL